MKKILLPCLLAASAAYAPAQSYTHTVEAEKLDRGIVAVTTDSGVLVSWRSLSSDAPDLSFDVYRGEQKLNDAPITRSTNLLDPDGKPGDTYKVVCLADGAAAESQETKAWDSIYKKVHLQRPEGGISPAGGKDEMREYTYTPDDVSVGDVDGDGQYELFVKWFPTNQADNSFRRFTGNTYIDCYKMDGTMLWRVDLGVNIRSGNHYTQFMVYDFDGDGKAELMCKTAPGTIDGKGKPVVMGDDDPLADYRNAEGIILKGPEYLTVFEGATGAEITSVAYNPPRSIISNWGDNYGNRCERYLACVAYLDGEHPSAVFCRGYYTASYLWAVDFDGKNITERWLHESTTKGAGAYGEGAHSITVGDVDADGKDEIVFGGASIDDDGKLLYRTGTGHGDALHLSQMIPSREGLQVYMPHEEKGSAYKWDAELRDARTGEILYGVPQSGNDNGRGLAANISSLAPGYEYWSSTHRGVQNQGNDLGSAKPSINFRVYWDGDLLDELLDGTTVTKPNDALTSLRNIQAFAGYSNAASCNGTKKTPNLQADIMGDWREEIILHDGSTESDLLIFSTPYPTDYKVTCLMQNRQYREAIAWQNVAYNQPPHLSYCLEEAFNTDGVITVKNGTLSQVVNIGESMTPVAFAVTRATGIKVEQAPEWINVAFDEASLTGEITGTPDAEGEYTLRISTTGAEGRDGRIEGKIVVRRNQSLTLMAQYPFDTVGDDTPNSIHGSALAYDGAATATDGKKGNAMSLNGTNYYMQDAYEALDFGAADFTIEMWIRSTDDAAYLLHKGSIAANAATGATGNWVGIELKNNTLKFAIDDDKVKSGIDVSGADKWMDGEWHQIVMVRDTYNKTLQAYVDGELVGDASDATGAINCAKEPLVIGNVNVNFNNTLKGDIDELSIYRGAMSAAKVLEHYKTIGNELAYLPMDALSEGATPNQVFGQAHMVGEGLQLVEGVKGGAIKFNNSAYLQQDAYEAIQMGENDFTVAMWMLSTDDNAYLIFKGSHSANASKGTTGNWWGIERKNGYLTFTIDDDNSKTDCKLADANHAFDGKWHHIAAVRSAADATMTLYIDGKEAASASNVKTGALADNMEALIIGGSDETDRQFDGLIDEVTILPRAITAAEAEEMYAQLKDAADGIADVIADAAPATRLTVVSATTGMIVREAYADASYSIIDSLSPDIYILVKESGDSSESYKFIVK